MKPSAQSYFPGMVGVLQRNWKACVTLVNVFSPRTTSMGPLTECKLQFHVLKRLEKHLALQSSWLSVLYGTKCSFCIYRLMVPVSGF